MLQTCFPFEIQITKGKNQLYTRRTFRRGGDVLNARAPIIGNLLKRVLLVITRIIITIVIVVVVVIVLERTVAAIHSRRRQ